MSKRRRDGNTLLETKRPRIIQPFHPTVATPQSLLGKRGAPESESVQRPCPTTWTSIGSRGEKRHAEFDIEIHRLQKRLRATTPTAEEAIVFLLPHIMQMRTLYLGEQDKASRLQQLLKDSEENKKILSNVLRAQLTEKNRLQRQLDNALYRLTLSPYNNLS